MDLLLFVCERKRKRKKKHGWISERTPFTVDGIQGRPLWSCYAPLDSYNQYRVQSWREKKGPTDPFPLIRKGEEPIDSVQFFPSKDGFIYKTWIGKRRNAFSMQERASHAFFSSRCISTWAIISSIRHSAKRSSGHEKHIHRVFFMLEKKKTLVQLREPTRIFFFFQEKFEKKCNFCSFDRIVTKL